MNISFYCVLFAVGCCVFLSADAEKKANYEKEIAGEDTYDASEFAVDTESEVAIADEESSRGCIPKWKECSHKNQNCCGKSECKCNSDWFGDTICKCKV